MIRALAAPAACLVLLALASGCGGDAYDELAPLRRNLILISIDTLRADRLGSYGYTRPTSPTLDELARRGARFETVIAESNWTLPSHVTLFTGLPPGLHGVRQPIHRIPDALPTLPEVLREAGFRTFGLTGLAFVDHRFGFDRGFDRYARSALSLADSLKVALRIMARERPGERIFLFIHSYDVHCPYEPDDLYAQAFQTEPQRSEVPTADRCGEQFASPPLEPGQVRYLSDRYDASIRQADDQIGVFLDRLEELGSLAETVVCVVSDHGEAFLEHGQIGHRTSLYLESLRVPWIVAGPGIAPRVLARPVGLADVMPTLLELVGVPAPAAEGSSQAPLIAGRERDGGARALFSENDWNRRLRSAVVGDHHAIADASGELRVFDWRRDPAEQTDLFGSDPRRDAALRVRLRARDANLEARRRLEPGRAAVKRPKYVEQLRALGYVE